MQILPEEQESNIGLIKKHSKIILNQNYNRLILKQNMSNYVRDLIPIEYYFDLECSLNITVNPTTIIIPFVNLASHPYLCTIDWGDTIVTQVTAYNGAGGTHIYGSTGVYTVKINGIFRGLDVNNDANFRNTLTGITKISNNYFVELKFQNCANLVSVSDTNIFDTRLVTSLSSMFQGCTSLTTVNSLLNCNTTNVTSVENMFNGCTLFNSNIGTWNLTNCSNFDGFLTNCTNFDQDLSGITLKTTNPVSMVNAFDNCGLSVFNYNKLLDAWKTYVVANGGPTNVSMGAIGLSYTDSGISDGNAARNNLINNYGWTFTGDAPFAFPTANLNVVYSVRKVVTAYGGSCMTVRRSSDDTEQTFGFVGDELDTTSLLTFVGTGPTDNGFIKVIFDQSGNANNAEQLTQSLQPKIVSAGVVIVNDNGKPAIDFDAAQYMISVNNSGISGDPNYSWYSVKQMKSLPNNAACVMGSGGYGNGLFIDLTMVDKRGFGSWNSNVIYADLPTIGVSEISSGAKISGGITTDFYRADLDGVTLTDLSIFSGVGINIANTPYTFGDSFDLRGFDGYVSEIIIYLNITHDLKTRQGIISLMNSYFRNFSPW